jgi:hypothetical protein
MAVPFTQAGLASNPNWKLGFCRWRKIIPAGVMSEIERALANLGHKVSDETWGMF